MEIKTSHNSNNSFRVSGKKRLKWNKIFNFGRMKSSNKNPSCFPRREFGHMKSSNKNPSCFPRRETMATVGASVVSHIDPEVIDNESLIYTNKSREHFTVVNNHIRVADDDCYVSSREELNKVKVIADQSFSGVVDNINNEPSSMRITSTNQLPPISLYTSDNRNDLITERADDRAIKMNYSGSTRKISNVSRQKQRRKKQSSRTNSDIYVSSSRSHFDSAANKSINKCGKKSPESSEAIRNYKTKIERMNERFHSMETKQCEEDNFMNQTPWLKV